MDFFSFAFSNVNFFVRLEEDVFFWHKLKKDKSFFA